MQCFNKETYFEMCFLEFFFDFLQEKLNVEMLRFLSLQLTISNIYIFFSNIIEINFHFLSFQ